MVFYTNGKACLHMPEDGTLTVWAGGSFAEERWPRFAIQSQGERVDFHISRSDGIIVTAEVSGGEEACIVYEDDAIDGEGRDRNLWLTNVRCSEIVMVRG